MIQKYDMRLTNYKFDGTKDWEKKVNFLKYRLGENSIKDVILTCVFNRYDTEMLKMQKEMEKDSKS